MIFLVLTAFVLFPSLLVPFSLDTLSFPGISLFLPTLGPLVSSYSSGPVLSLVLLLLLIPSFFIPFESGSGLISFFSSLFDPDLGTFDPVPPFLPTVLVFFGFIGPASPENQMVL